MLRPAPPRCAAAEWRTTLSLNMRARPRRAAVRLRGSGATVAGGVEAVPRPAMGGRIECVFFSEFHPTLGPKITYQVRGERPGARSACPRRGGWD